jgi:hypothetical protein
VTRRWIRLGEVVERPNGLAVEHHRAVVEGHRLAEPAPSRCGSPSCTAAVVLGVGEQEGQEILVAELLERPEELVTTPSVRE